MVISLRYLLCQVAMSGCYVRLLCQVAMSGCYVRLLCQVAMSGCKLKTKFCMVFTKRQPDNPLSTSRHSLSPLKGKPSAAKCLITWNRICNHFRWSFSIFVTTFGKVLPVASFFCFWIQAEKLSECWTDASCLAKPFSFFLSSELESNACFQSLYPTSVKVVDVMLMPNTRHGKQKQTSFTTKYSNQLRLLYQEELNALSVLPNSIFG